MGAEVELSRLATAVDFHAAAVAAALAAGDGRARAAFEARRAGASLAQLAAALGVSRPTALELARRGEQLAGVPAGSVVSPGPVPAAAAPAVAPPAATCLRGGCPLPAALGARFCAAHRYC